MAACKAALNIKGEHFPCEVDAPHRGLAHSNEKSQAIWADEHTDLPEPKEKDFGMKRAEALKRSIEGNRVQ